MIRYTMLASFFVMSSLVYGQQGNPVPCQEVRQVTIATDARKIKILSNFIQKCVQEGLFPAVYDKGILHLYEYHNSKNNLCWSLFARIDDDYKDNPPMRFSDFQGDIVLVYEADSTGRPEQAEGDKQAINACLERIIGDRVFSRPTIRSRWTNGIIPFVKKIPREGIRRNQTGGGGIYVEFHKDNTYTISPMM